MHNIVSYCLLHVNMNLRRHQKRFLILLLFAVFSVYIIVHFLWTSNDHISCLASADTLKQLEELLRLTQEPLKTLNLTFFICYTTLWGVLKFKGPLPWQNSLDLCVLNKEMSAIDEGFLARSFKRSGLSITYNSASGFYKVSKIDVAEPFVTLTVFEEDLITRQMRRVGWMYRMLPPNSCDELNCFPPELISKPLPTSKFNKLEVPIPRDGIEIQKYLFPDSWWKEITPPDCQS